MAVRKKKTERKKTRKPLVAQVLTDNGMLLKRKRAAKRK
jgi:hypothetical protein